ncbi:MAG TPA: metallophosphoesterase family protein [Candidatus Eisenbacteria bacterium]|nr:metallophosphoesterase family protein [Candidatus Eisenbacteria bacterium]
MKIVIISDIHGNFDSLSALPESYDELWVLGDLVNYGPEPQAVIEYVRAKASFVVRGNHDHSIGFNEDPGCSPPFREMAEATRRFTDSVLTFGCKHFLRQLPLRTEIERAGTRFYLCHAIPSDPLFGYCEASSDQWIAEAGRIDADFILVGHTHVPAVRAIGSCVVVNPGSLGQPKGGGPEAWYAVWKDGVVELKTYPYPVESAVAKVGRLPIASTLRDELSEILRTGNIPRAKEAHNGHVEN